MPPLPFPPSLPQSPIPRQMSKVPPSATLHERFKDDFLKMGLDRSDGTMPGSVRRRGVETICLGGNTMEARLQLATLLIDALKKIPTLMCAPGAAACLAERFP